MLIANACPRPTRWRRGGPLFPYLATRCCTLCVPDDRPGRTAAVPVKLGCSSQVHRSGCILSLSSSPLTDGIPVPSQTGLLCDIPPLWVQRRSRALCWPHSVRFRDTNHVRRLRWLPRVPTSYQRSSESIPNCPTIWLLNRPSLSSTRVMLLYYCISKPSVPLHQPSTYVVRGPRHRRRRYRPLGESILRFFGLYYCCLPEPRFIDSYGYTVDRRGRSVYRV